MSDREKDPMWDDIREAYNVPTEAPRDRMWEAISTRLDDAERGDDGAVIDLAARRAERGAAGPVRRERVAGWGVAAAAVLVLGIGIGRLTAPATPGAEDTVAASTEVTGPSLKLAAEEHLGQMESLLTMVRADARAGRVDPGTSAWADELLTQTRLLIDAAPGTDATTRDLLLDLELVLIQIAAVSETGSTDEARTRVELELALRSLEEGEVLPRIQAALPAGLAGT